MSVASRVQRAVIVRDASIGGATLRAADAFRRQGSHRVRRSQGCGLISADQFRTELRAKRQPAGGVYRVSTEPPVPVEGVERTLRFVFSDDSVDRMGDTIDAAGWDISDFERNPVALWAHDSSQPPIGGARNVLVEGGRLLGDIEFAPPETYEFADTIYRLVLGKFLRAVSVGFMPTKHVFVENQPDRPWGIDFLEQSLLEISVCPIPANPNALQEARAKGIDTRPMVAWAERALDDGGRVFLSREELQRLRKAAKEPTMATKPRARPGHVQRSDGANETDPADGGAIVGNCGRGPDDACGMTDPGECSVHGQAREAPDSDEKLLKRLRRLLTGQKDAPDGDSGIAGDARPSDDDLPVAHEDAIRLSHKAMRTAKAYMADAMGNHTKALNLLDGVVRALDADPATDQGADPEPAPANAGADPAGKPDPEKAAQLARAAALKAKHKV